MHTLTEMCLWRQAKGDPKSQRRRRPMRMALNSQNVDRCIIYYIFLDASRHFAFCAATRRRSQSQSVFILTDLGKRQRAAHWAHAMLFYLKFPVCRRRPSRNESSHTSRGSRHLHFLDARNLQYSAHTSCPLAGRTYGVRRMNRHQPKVDTNFLNLDLHLFCFHWFVALRQLIPRYFTPFWTGLEAPSAQPSYMVLLSP